MSTGRVKVEDFPHAHPGRCALCGAQAAHDGRKYIDFGQQVPHYGAVYFCTVCLVEVMDALGWTSPSITRNLRAEIGLQDRLIADLKEENERLRIAISSIDLVSAFSTSMPLPVGDVSGDLEVEESRDLKSFDTPERSEEDFSGYAESSNVRGSSDLLGVEIPDTSNFGI